MSAVVLRVMCSLATIPSQIPWLQCMDVRPELISLQLMIAPGNHQTLLNRFDEKTNKTPGQLFP